MTDYELEEMAYEQGIYHDGAEILRAYYENYGDLDGFEDSYVGCYEGRDEYDAAGNYAFETEGYIVRDMPEYLRMYFDWTKYGRDLILGGHYWAERVGVDEYALFYNR